MGQKNSRSIRKLNTHINCLYTNADQLNNKFSELELMVQSNSYDIILITEIKPKNQRFSIFPGEYSLDGYDMYHANIDSIIGRGCLMYAKKYIHVKEITLDNNFTEYILMELVNTDGQQILIGCIYRSPNSSNDNNNLLNLLVEEI